MTTKVKFRVEGEAYTWRYLCPDGAHMFRYQETSKSNSTCLNAQKPLREEYDDSYSMTSSRNYELGQYLRKHVSQEGFYDLYTVCYKPRENRVTVSLRVPYPYIKHSKNQDILKVGRKLDNVLSIKLEPFRAVRYNTGATGPRNICLDSLVRDLMLLPQQVLDELSKYMPVPDMSELTALVLGHTAKAKEIREATKTAFLDVLYPNLRELGILFGPNTDNRHIILETMFPLRMLRTIGQASRVTQGVKKLTGSHGKRCMNLIREPTGLSLYWLTVLKGLVPIDVAYDITEALKIRWGPEHLQLTGWNVDRMRKFLKAVPVKLLISLRGICTQANGLFMHFTDTMQLYKDCSRIIDQERAAGYGPDFRVDFYKALAEAESWGQLHTALVFLFRGPGEKEKLELKLEVKEFMTQLEARESNGYTIRFPRTGKDVHHWGMIQHHCIFTYMMNHHKGTCILAALYKGEELVANMMWQSGGDYTCWHLGQFYAKYNGLPDKEAYEALTTLIIDQVKEPFLGQPKLVSSPV